MQGKESKSGLHLCFEATTLTLVLWVLLLVLGGGLLSLYYAGIHYMPDIQWDKSLTYLGVLSMLGGGVMVTYGLLLFVPGVIYSKFLIQDEQLGDQLCLVDVGSGDKPCAKKVSLHIVEPFAILVVFVHVLMYLVALCWMGWILALILAGTVLVACAARSAYVFGQTSDDENDVQFLVAPIVRWFWEKILRRSGKKPAEEPAQEKSQEEGGEHSLSAPLKAFLVFLVGGFLSCFSLLLIYQLVDPRGESPVAMLILCTISVVLANFFVAMNYQDSKIASVVLSLVIALFLLVSGHFLSGEHSNASMSKRLMAMYGFGGDETYTVLVSDEGSTVLQEISRRKQQKDDAPSRRLSGVKILSRLGEEYVFERRGKRIVLPKEMVVAWYQE